MTDQNISRRDLLAVSGAFAIAATATSSVSAAEGHSQHTMDAMNKHQAVIDAALDCVRKGTLCMDHCLQLFKANDNSVAGCAIEVNQMLPMCETLGKLAMTDSKYLVQLARICIDACADCEKECKKHAEHHAACKACAESCAACIKACKELAA